MAQDATPAAATTAGPVDPYRSFNFKLEVKKGLVEGHFTECSGLGIRVHPIRYREGGVGQIVRVIPGAVEYSEVVLRYGLTSSRDLWDWFMKSVRGQVERRNVSVIMLADNNADEALRWNLVNAWPSEWRGATLDALGREAAIEELKLAYDSLDRA
jgi:phage tail-like protein